MKVTYLLSSGKWNWDSDSQHCDSEFGLGVLKSLLVMLDHDLEEERLRDSYF